MRRPNGMGTLILSSPVTVAASTTRTTVTATNAPKIIRPSGVSNFDGITSSTNATAYMLRQATRTLRETQQRTERQEARSGSLTLDVTREEPSNG